MGIDRLVAERLRVFFCKAACAAFALFLACLAVFLLALANLRSSFRTALASRTFDFTASACAAVFSASVFNRCAAVTCLARPPEEFEVATMRASLKNSDQRA